MPRTIDLRSDTVTRPTPAMWEVMARAPLGDDVLGDDPSVAALEAKVAALLGKDAACFVPSGTMGNQAAIRAHTEPGDEVIAHEDSHIILYEGGGPAVISGCMVRGLRGARGQFGALDVDGAVRPDNVHFPRSRLLVLENTHNRGGGAVWSLEHVDAVTGAARRHGLRTHMDGARLWNACVAGGVTPRDYARYFDSVSCCFSKGLGAPVGSAVAGTSEFIHKVRRVRKLLGGGMRQSGVLAAAAGFALDHHVARLAHDHAHARLFAEGVGAVPGVSLDACHAAFGVESNIVLFELGPAVPVDAAGLCARLEQEGVLMLPTGARRIRAVTHLDVDREGVLRAVEAVSRAARR
ncbi:MAG: GntG family PLP-dependent aldolase [Phycisphaerales bacterium]